MKSFPMRCFPQFPAKSISEEVKRFGCRINLIAKWWPWGRAPGGSSSPNNRSQWSTCLKSPEFSPPPRQVSCVRTYYTVNYPSHLCLTWPPSRQVKSPEGMQPSQLIPTRAWIQLEIFNAPWQPISGFLVKMKHNFSYKFFRFKQNQTTLFNFCCHSIGIH